MEDKYELSSLSQTDLSTLLHGGLAEKQDTKLKREIYLCEAKIYGIRDEEKLKEYLTRVSVGDVVRLYLRFYDDLPATLNDDQEYWPDDGHNVRIHTFDGGCLGYMQPLNEYAIAEFMMASQKIYAKVSHVIDDSVYFDRWEAVRLKIYWVIESDPLSTELTVIEPEKENEIAFGAFEGDIALGQIIADLKVSDDKDDKTVRKIRCNERLIVYKGSRESQEVFVRTIDGEYKGKPENYSETVPNLLDAGKSVYAVVTEILVDRTDKMEKTRLARVRIMFYLELTR